MKTLDLTHQISNYDNIPAAMRDTPNWVGNRLKPHAANPDKMQKVPWLTSGKGPARSNEPADWTTFEAACRAVADRKVDGITYMMVPDDGLVCIDLDNVRDPQTGTVKPDAFAIVQELDSYTEISESGRGLHTWVRGSVPKASHKKGSWLEIYANKKAMATTGNVFVTEDFQMYDTLNARDITELFNRAEAGEFAPPAASTTPRGNVAGENPSGADFALACRLVRKYNGDLDKMLPEFISKSTQHPKKLLDREDYAPRTLKNAIAAVQANQQDVPPIVLQPWPEPIAAEAFHGVAGEFVRAVEPETESDPAALLLNFLVLVGVLFGREAYVKVEAQRHYPNENVVMVGDTSNGRKGTATGRTQQVMERVLPDFRDRMLGGLSSGEGLIKALVSLKEKFANAQPEGERDCVPIDFNTQPAKAIATVAICPEFESVLGVQKRDSNILGSILREAWDGGRLRVLTRKDPLDVDDVNLSVIAHVTAEGLLNSLTAVDRANGFANRFMFACVQRSKYLPDGGGDVDFNSIVMKLHDAVQTAKGRGRMKRDEESRALWHEVYAQLTTPSNSIRGALLGRAAPHVTRLSLLYALLDGADAIRVEHLKAALAVWKYCEDSVTFIFGNVSVDWDGDKILTALAGGPLTTDEISRTVFQKNKAKDWVEAKMHHMVREGKVAATTKDGERKQGLPAWTIPQA